MIPSAKITLEDFKQLVRGKDVVVQARTADGYMPVSLFLEDAGYEQFIQELDRAYSEFLERQRG